MSSGRKNIPKLGGVKKYKKLPELPISTILKPASTNSSRVEFEKFMTVKRLTNLKSYVLLPENRSLNFKNIVPERNLGAVPPKTDEIVSVVGDTGVPKRSEIFDRIRAVPANRMELY